MLLHIRESISFYVQKLLVVLIVYSCTAFVSLSIDLDSKQYFFETKIKSMRIENETECLFICACLSNSCEYMVGVHLAIP